MNPNANHKALFDNAVNNLNELRDKILKASTPDELAALEREARGAILNVRYFAGGLERWVREAVGARRRKLNEFADAKAQEIISSINITRPTSIEAADVIREAEKPAEKPKAVATNQLEEDDDYEIVRPDPEEDELPDVIGATVADDPLVKKSASKQKATYKKSSKKGA